METAFYKLDDFLAGRMGTRYQEFLRVSAMSAGVYILPSRETDAQKPHGEDEIYYVIRGRARMRAGDQDREINPGDIIFVAKEVEHRFYDIREDLAVLVIFAPAESS
jgi:mannose-6-phosphate isomerase-like protein (cupin superfamily)